MKHSRISRRIAGSLLTGLLLLTGGVARAQSSTTSYLDLEAGLGFSTNAGFRLDNESSAYGRISATGVHAWTTESGRTSLRGYLENTTYLQHYGSKQIWTLNADTVRRVSPTVTLFGGIGFSGDFGGQLSNRLFDVPDQPPLYPDNPLPPTYVVPDLYGLSGRQYRLNGDVGASIRAGARGTVSLSAGALRAFSSGSNNQADYTSYNGSVSYSQQVSERTNAGARLSVVRQDFERGDASTTINPALTASTRLSETLTADASVGVMRIEQEIAGFEEHTTALSFAGSLCSQGTISRLCGRVSRDAQTALTSTTLGGRAASTIATSASLTYSRKIGEGSLQASLSAVRYMTPRVLVDDELHSSYLSGVVGYNRPIGTRLYAGVQGGARKLFQSGPDPQVDFTATAYVRYRLGDIK